MFFHFFDFQLTTKINMIFFQILNFCRFRTWSSNLKLIECVVVVYVDEFEIVVNVEIVEILDLIFEMFKRKENFATRIDEFLKKRTFRNETKTCIFVNSNTIFYFECDVKNKNSKFSKMRFAFRQAIRLSKFEWFRKKSISIILQFDQR